MALQAYAAQPCPKWDTQCYRYRLLLLKKNSIENNNLQCSNYNLIKNINFQNIK